MRKKTWMIVGGALMALVLIGAAGAAVVYAQSPTPTAPTGGQMGGGGPGGLGHGDRNMPQAELDAAAKALNMTSDELSTQLKNGKTLSDLATSQGVRLQSVQDAIQAARSRELEAQIKQAVTDGQMTQGKADWLLEGLNKGYLDGPGGFGLGRGFGFGGPGPNGAQPPAQAVPTTTP